MTSGLPVIDAKIVTQRKRIARLNSRLARDQQLSPEAVSEESLEISRGCVEDAISVLAELQTLRDLEESEPGRVSFGVNVG